MKALLFLTALTLSSALAQFGWDDEPSVDPVPGAVDSFDHVLRTPAIEPFEYVLRPFRSVLNADEDPLVGIRSSSSVTSNRKSRRFTAKPKSSRTTRIAPPTSGA
jgi:hypothetical protein